MNNRVIRAREIDIARRIAGRQAPPSTAKGGFVGKVIDGGMLATGPDDYVLVNPVSVSGAESEGGVGTLDVDMTRTVAVVLLNATPVVGDLLICKPEGNRWVAAKPGKKGSPQPVVPPVVLPYCFCSPPATLAMTSADTACNFRMFQDDTLQYGPTPPEYANLNLGPSCFLGAGSFPDPVAGGAMFRYYFSCIYNSFNLSRVYATSPYGSPFRDGVLYSWSLGAADNSCEPFVLANGQAMPGSDASCEVLIDG